MADQVTSPVDFIVGYPESSLDGLSLDSPVDLTTSGVLEAPSVAGPGGFVEPVPVDLGGTARRSYFYDLLFHDRIHVVPRRKDLGSVLSDQVVAVEVWNAYLERAKVLDEITVEGTAGVEVDNPHGLPTHYPGSESKIYDVNVDAEGDPLIDNLITWVFLDVTEETDLRLLGSRVSPWPFAPNENEPVRMRYGYLTEILGSWRHGEQRRQKRSLPVGALNVKSLIRERRQAQKAQAILYGSQARPIGVPIWPFKVPLLAAAAEGAQFLFADTESSIFHDGGLVFVWRGPGDWEAQRITTVDSVGLNLSLGLRKSWPAGTMVMPLVQGRLTQKEDFTWVSLEIAEAELAFRVESYGTPELPLPTLRTYKGYDVLDFYEFDRQGRTKETHDRKFAVMAPEGGLVTVDEQSPAPAPVRAFVWSNFSRAETLEMLAWIDHHKGRTIPFWLPSYQWDMTLAQELIEDETIAHIVWKRYTEQEFPNTNARRHVALYAPNVAMDFYGIAAAEDPGDEETEALTITPAAVRDYDPRTTLISHLKLCRLEDDEVEIDFIGGRVSRAVIRVREIPDEAPAP